MIIRFYCHCSDIKKQTWQKPGKFYLPIAKCQMRGKRALFVNYIFIISDIYIDNIHVLDYVFELHFVLLIKGLI